MLLIFLSTTWSSAFISASPGNFGPCVTVPSIRPPLCPPGRLRAEPVVWELLPVDVPPDGAPVELAVPRLFVPGAVGTLAAFPAPLGSLTELLLPPRLAGPLGTPVTAWPRWIQHSVYPPHLDSLQWDRSPRPFLMSRRLRRPPNSRLLLLLLLPRLRHFEHRQRLAWRAER